MLRERIEPERQLGVELMETEENGTSESVTAAVSRPVARVVMTRVLWGPETAFGEALAAVTMVLVTFPACCSAAQLAAEAAARVPPGVCVAAAQAAAGALQELQVAPVADCDVELAGRPLVDTWQE